VIRQCRLYLPIRCPLSHTTQLAVVIVNLPRPNFTLAGRRCGRARTWPNLDVTSTSASAAPVPSLHEYLAVIHLLKHTQMDFVSSMPANDAFASMDCWTSSSSSTAPAVFVHPPAQLVTVPTTLATGHMETNREEKMPLTTTMGSFANDEPGLMELWHTSTHSPFSTSQPTPVLLQPAPSRTSDAATLVSVLSMGRLLHPQTSALRVTAPASSYPTLRRYSTSPTSSSSSIAVFICSPV
jgi:hypothetical protein